MAGLYAQEPLFVVTFWWGGFGFSVDPNSPYVRYCTSYAYRELTSEEFPLPNGFAYGFLKSLTGFSTELQIDGFGQVNQLSAEFIDYFGHFRFWMASRNIYTDIMVEVGLYFRNPDSTPDNPLKGTLYKVFEGKIREPVVWNEADRTFKCDFVSDTWFKNIGYMPSLENILLQRFVPDPPVYRDTEDGKIITNEGAGSYQPYIDTERLLLQQNINTEVWPQLFGRATDIPVTPIANTPEFEVADDVPCRFGWGREYKELVRQAFVQNPDDLDAIFDNAALVIPLDENNQFFMAIERDYTDFHYTYPPEPEYPGGPYQPHVPERTVVLNNYQSMDTTLPFNMMTVDIETEGEIVRCAGYMIDKFFVVPNGGPGQETKFFNLQVAETPISCSKVHQCYENPEYVLWLDYNSPTAAGKLTPAQQIIAAGPMPPQWVSRPDYVPNLLKLNSTEVVVATRTNPGGSSLEYDKYYTVDDEIGIGWYFVYNGNIYVVTLAPIPGGRYLEFSPALPNDMSIEVGTQIDIISGNTPWLQNQYISFNVVITTPNYNYSEQSRDENGNLLYLQSGNITTNVTDRYGNSNAPYPKVISSTERQLVVYARVNLQMGPYLYLEGMTLSIGKEARNILISENAKVTTISVVTGNLPLQATSMSLRVQDYRKNKRGSKRQRRLGYRTRDKKSPYTNRNYLEVTPHYTIRANAKMRIVDWWASHTYPVTTDIGQVLEPVYPDTLRPLWYFQVYLEAIWAYVNGRPVPLLGPRSGKAGENLPTDQYRRNDYFELKPELLLIPTHRDPGEMHEYYGGIYYPSSSSSLLIWPNHVSITLYPTPFNLMLQSLAANAQQVELRAAACNTLNSDEIIFKEVLENHTPYFYQDISTLKTADGYDYDIYGLAFQHQNMGVLTESMDVREFLAKLAWENAKHIQIRGQYAGLVDFFKEYNPMIIFDMNNIDAKSITLEYVSFEDLITQFNVTMTNGALWVMKGATPFGPFDYSTLKGAAVGYDLNTWKMKDIQILLNQTFRPDDLNMDVPLLDGYVKLSNLYPQFLLPQKPWPASNYPVDAPEWLLNMPQYPVEWAERSINSVLHWWLHYESRVWTIMTFKTYVDESNTSFYLRAGDIVAFNLEGPTVKLFEDEQPPATPSGPALPSGYPMEKIDGIATNYDHSKIEYYSMNLDPEPGQKYCSGRALVLSTNLDPEEWLITVKVLLPITAEGTL